MNIAQYLELLYRIAKLQASTPQQPESDCPTLSLSPAPGSLPSAEVGTSYNTTISVLGGQDPITTTVTPNTVNGLEVTVSNDGRTITISGTPTQSGTITFEVNVQDSCPTSTQTIAGTYTISVAACPTITANPASGTTFYAEVGQQVNETIQISGGYGPLTITVNPTEANGLTASVDSTNNTVTISGTPTSPTDTTFTITVQDSCPEGPQTVDFNYTVVTQIPAGITPDNSAAYIPVLLGGAGPIPYYVEFTYDSNTQNLTKIAIFDTPQKTKQYASATLNYNASNNLASASYTLHYVSTVDTTASIDSTFAYNANNDITAVNNTATISYDPTVYTVDSYDTVMAAVLGLWGDSAYIDYTYDSNGNLTQVNVYADSNRQTQIASVTFTYDTNGNLTSAQANYTLSNNAQITTNITYTYDTSGKLVSITALTTINGTLPTQLTVYDINLLSLLSTWPTNYSLTFTYDQTTGSVSSITLTVDGQQVATQTITYDSNNNIAQITTQTNNWTSNITFTYDANGNLVSITNTVQ